MRVIDAYRRGVITYEEYLALLGSGTLPNSIYTTPVIPETGPSNAYSTILTWDCEGLGPKSIAIENQDTVYDLQYKIECYIDDLLVENISDIVESEEITNVYLEEPYTEVIVSVRSRQYGESPSYDFAYTYSQVT